MLARADLLSLEQYALQREAFRARVIDHKKLRRVALGAAAALYFEDQLTMQYQVQEMLRLERIFEAESIQAELDVYNPLIPDGANWKATFMLEIPAVEERRQRLAQWIGIEECVWLTVGDLPRIVPIANEDLPRTQADKTSAVHFLRFELTPAHIQAAQAEQPVTAGIDHPHYLAHTRLNEATRRSLLADLR